MCQVHITAHTQFVISEYSNVTDAA
jgi:hypothetical protein